MVDLSKTIKNLKLAQKKGPQGGSGATGGKGYTLTNKDKNNPFDTKWSSNPVPTTPGGRPLTPEFVSIGDKRTGLLQAPYNVDAQLDTRAMDQLRSEALRPEGQMSKWGQMALAQASDTAARQQVGATSQAQNQLAQQGGLRSGARERIAQQGGFGRLQAGQQALQGVQMADEQNRQGLLRDQTGKELGQAGYLSGIQGQNINKALGEIFQKRASQQMQFSDAMKGWAAERTAAATPSGKK